MPTRPAKVPDPAALRAACRAIALTIAVLWSTLAFAGTITVDTELDELDLLPNDRCSLREAIVTVNEQRQLGVGGCRVVGTIGTGDTIVVPAGTYRLTRRQLFSSGQDTGSLDVRRSVRIVGAGASSTIVDGQALHNVMLVVGGVVRIEGLTLQNGKADSELWMGRGAGLRTDNASTHVVLEDVVVRDNRAFRGGGIENGLGTLTLRRTVVRDNVATSGPGAGIYNSGHLIVIDSEISGNRTASVYGAGIFTLVHLGASASTRVITSTVSGNMADGVGLGGLGGGIYSEGARLVLNSATVTANSSGIYQVNVGDHSIEAYNTLIAGNLSNDCHGRFVSRGYNLIGGAQGCAASGATASDQFGTTSAPIDARLGPLLRSSGPTRTHALLDGSPAIDRGALGSDVGCGSVDQRGRPRPTDGTGDGIVRCDIGAYEKSTVPYTADLRVRITQSSAEVFPNEPIAITAEIVNHGPARALNARYEITVPVGAPLPQLPPGCEPTATRTYGCLIGTIAQGATHTIGAVLQAPNTLGDAQTTVSASSDVPDPLGGNTASVTTRVVAPPNDIHVIVVATENPVGPLSEFTYRVVVQNRSARTTATDVVVRHALSPGTVANNCDPYRCDISFERVIVRGHPDTIQPGESITHNLNVTAPATAGAITNTVTVISTPFGTSTASTSGTVLPPAADLAMVLGVSHDRVDPGAPLTYVVDGSNFGPSRTDATFTLTIPEGAAFGSLRGTKDCDQSDDQTLTCGFLNQISPGHANRAHVEVLAPAVEGLWSATAEITGPFPDPNLANNVASVTVAVGDEAMAAALADVSLSVSVPPFVLPGQPITYGFVVTNLGPATATGIHVADGLPQTLTVVSRSDDCSPPNGTPGCRLSELPYGASHLFEVTVIAPDTQGVIVTTASVTTSSVDPVTANDSAPARTEVVAELPGDGPAVRVEAGPRTLPDLTIANGTDGVPALQVLFVAEAPGVGLTALRLAREASPGAPGGTLRIYHDVDADADVGADDVLVATATFTSSDTDLIITLDPNVAVDAQGGTVMLVTLDVEGTTGTTGAPILAGVGLVALFWLRRSRRGLLTLSVVAALTVAGCAGTPAVDTTTIRLHLTHASYTDPGVLTTGTPIAGPRITVR